MLPTGFVDPDQLLGLNRTSWKSKFEDVAFEFCKSEFNFYFLAVFKFFFFFLLGNKQACGYRVTFSKAGKERSWRRQTEVHVGASSVGHMREDCISGFP